MNDKPPIDLSQDEQTKEDPLLRVLIDLILVSGFIAAPDGIEVRRHRIRVILTVEPA